MYKLLPWIPVLVFVYRLPKMKLSQFTRMSPSQLPRMFRRFLKFECPRSGGIMPVWLAVLYWVYIQPSEDLRRAYYSR